SVLNRARLFQAMTPSHVNSVGVAVPDQLDRGEGVVPAEIAATDAGPVRGEVAMLANNPFFLDREDATAAQDGDALSAGLKFVFGITGDNPLLLVRAVMHNIINGHEGDVPVWRLLVDKPAHDF